ncbi:MAG: hypothetical protein QOH32_3169 [Bradyrhizobium sp.]|jgi:PIN domain nuclease of toxin-antitoxin system|nr:hypothetical protein [Bradyrhizobium sp.]
MLTLLLDTHAAIWLVRNERVAQGAEEAINAVHETNGTLLLSPVTAWEVGLLVSLRRLDLFATAQAVVRAPAGDYATERSWLMGRAVRSARWRAELHATYSAAVGRLAP